ncbi:MAG: hypothetical protein ACK5OX_10795 [Desertimonas sp.]
MSNEEKNGQVFGVIALVGHGDPCFVPAGVLQAAAKLSAYRQGFWRGAADTGQAIDALRAARYPGKIVLTP